MSGIFSSTQIIKWNIDCFAQYQGSSAYLDYLVQRELNKKYLAVRFKESSMDSQKRINVVQKGSERYKHVTRKNLDGKKTLSHVGKLENKEIYMRHIT